MSSHKVSVFLYGNVIHPSPGRDPVIIFPLMTYKTCNRHIMGTGGIDLLHLPAAFHIKRQPVFPLPWQQNTRNAQNDRQIFLQHSLNTPFPDVLEKKNASFLNYGVVVTKFTGARGKSGTSDASAEYVGRIRSLLNKNDIIWQTGELGKVDLGGGGTVAAYIANLNVDTIDVGVPVLSMHAPFEIVAKTDVYMAFRAFLVFLED